MRCVVSTIMMFYSLCFSTSTFSHIIVMQVGSGHFVWEIKSCLCSKSILSLTLKQLFSLVLLDATSILVLFGSNLLTHLIYSLIILYYNLYLLDMVITIDVFSSYRFLFHRWYWMNLLSLLDLFENFTHEG